MPLFKPTQEKIDKWKEQKKIKKLVNVLTSNEPGILKKAIKALEEIGDSQAVGPLINLVKDRNLNAEIRNLAIRALGELGDPKAAKPLIFEFEWSDTCLQAAESLVKISGTGAIEPIIRYLPKVEYPSQFERILAKFGEQAVEPIILAIKNTGRKEHKHFENVLIETGEPAVESLIKALENSDFRIRRSATIVLGKIADPKAYEPLLALLEDEDSRIRMEVVSSLNCIDYKNEKFRLSNYKNQLITLLKNNNFEARKFGVEALGKMGDASVLDLLFPLLEDDEEEIRDKTVSVLNDFLDPGSVGPLIKAWEDGRATYFIAETLKNLYHSGKLNDNQKKMILKKKGKCIRGHYDYTPKGCAAEVEHEDTPEYTFDV